MRGNSVKNSYTLAWEYRERLANSPKKQRLNQVGTHLAIMKPDEERAPESTLGGKHVRKT